VTVAHARAPFLDYLSFSAEAAEPPPPERIAAPPSRSPFLSVYELDGQDAEHAHDDPLRQAYAAFVGQLHDEEFDQAVNELQSHARAMHDEHLALGRPRAEADRLLSQHFAQLVQESEAMVEGLAREFGSRDESGLVDREFDHFLEGYEPSAPLEPEFENFFGKLVKKIGKVAKAAASTAWKGIKTLGLGPILNSIKALLKPLLNRVLQSAIGRLPVPVQPVARKLAEKLGFGAPRPAPAPAPAIETPAAPADMAMPADADAMAAAGASPVQDVAGSDDAPLQDEFDQQLAQAFLAQDEAELGLEVAQVRSSAAAGAPVFAELDDAREQFIQQLEALEDGESAAPHIQEFLPAVLPALRLGLRLAGRPRVVNFLAQLLAKLVTRLIGPQQAPVLSRAIVDAGLKLLNLEMSETQKAGLAASAVAATVEETAGRVAALPDYVLDNQELLEGFALEAFEQSAAANLPALFSEATYRQRPQLLEGGVNAGWLPLPLRGPKRYKRCSRAFKVRVSPHMAEEVQSFEGASLAEYLQDQLGLPEGAEVEGELHLYEALPGTRLTDIARGEKDTLGGLSDEAGAAQLHPFTPQAAAVLLGKPGLGRAALSALEGGPLAAGQRLYHLAIAGKRPLHTHGRQGQGGRHHRAHARRRLHLNTTLDAQQDQVRVCLFISEVKAQKLALSLRQPAGVGTLAAGFNRAVAGRLKHVFLGRGARRLRVLHGGLRPDRPLAAALQNLPRPVAAAFAARMQEWLVQGFAELLRTQPQRVLAATQDPADGITLQFSIERPPGLKEFCQALAGQAAAAGAAADALARGERPAIRVDVAAGHACA
jgi:hypothetical protein